MVCLTLVSKNFAATEVIVVIVNVSMDSISSGYFTSQTCTYRSDGCTETHTLHSIAEDS